MAHLAQPLVYARMNASNGIMEMLADIAERVAALDDIREAERAEERADRDRERQRRRKLMLRLALGCTVIGILLGVAVGLLVAAWTGETAGPSTPTADVPTVAPPSYEQEAQPEHGPEPKRPTSIIGRPGVGGAGEAWDQSVPPERRMK